MHEVLTLDQLRSMPPREAAALLFVRRSDGAGALDRDVLAGWLRLDAGNAQAWSDAERAWAVFDDAGDDEILGAMRGHALAARATPIVRRPQFAAIAATGLVLLTAGLLAMFVRGGGLDSGSNPAAVVARSGPAPPSGPTSYATLKGQEGAFTLADGSRMTLDTDSVVSVAFAGERRDLQLLKGRAFFDVKHDARRPFTVRANGREVVAVGTRFDVRLDPDAVRVVLVEGRVSVKSANAASPPTLMQAGQQLVDREGMAPVVSSAHVDEALNWQRGFVTFDDDTLAAAAAELNRYGADQLVVRDPRVARLRISGMFRAGDVPRFGRTLAQIHPVRIVRTGPNQLEIVAAN